jgi:hypothetical protein
MFVLFLRKPVGQCLHKSAIIPANYSRTSSCTSLCKVKSLTSAITMALACSHNQVGRSGASKHVSVGVTLSYTTSVYVTIGDSLYCNLHVHAKFPVRVATYIL